MQLLSEVGSLQHLALEKVDLLVWTTFPIHDLYEHQMCAEVKAVSQLKV